MVRKLDQFKIHWMKELQDWKDQGLSGEEQKNAQRFWIDLFGCFGVTATRMNLFERDATRSSTGGRGRIDLFWPSVVIGEAKKPGVDLQIAYDQAIDYLRGGSVGDHELPLFVLCSNFETFRLTKLGDPETRFEITFPLDEITEHVDQLRFLAGYESVTKQEEEEASIVASRLMSDLFVAMVGDEVDEAVGDDAPTNPEDEDERVQRTSMYLTRLLFLLFGDDSGLWRTDLFYEFVLDHTTPEDLGTKLDALFHVLNEPEESRSRRLPEHFKAFPYVNGALFADPLPVEWFNPEMRDALLRACRFNWSRISPALFGAMFQLVKSKAARHKDGEHYTSEKNILKTLDPLFLNEYREEARRLKSLADTAQNLRRLRAFRDSLADLIFADNALGAGNFLIVAYRELRRIETDIIVEIRRREGQTGMSFDVTWEQKLSINQFYGCELNWWPAKIAETAMFLVDHQANMELAHRIGDAPNRLPIKIAAHIHHGNALHLDWAKFIPETKGKTYLFGNPPFIGDSRAENQLADLERAWGESKKISRLDYVTGWYAKSLELLEQRDGEFAYVSTNSITQGDQVPRLFSEIFDRGWRIKFAHRTFAWDSEAPGKAAVHCVIIGFTRDRGTKQRLWDYPDVQGEGVEVALEMGINAYLLDGPNVLVTKASRPISKEIEKTAYGSKPTDGGFLIIDPEDYDRFMADPVAAKYVHRYVGAREVLHNADRWCLWLDGMDPADLYRSPLLKERVQKVKEFREASKAQSTRDFAQFPHLFRQRAKREVAYLCIPRHVSETRRYFTVTRYQPDVIASDANFTSPDPSGLQFALMSSSMFITWQKTIGGRLESRVRFGSTLTWYTFPVPSLDEKTREEIIKAGQAILAARELYPKRSLALHYAPLTMDPALVKAHDALDRVVDRAFGAPRKLTTERQRQVLLFDAYRDLTRK